MGGHFLAGGWALVMLFDHANGVDIRAHYRLPLFSLIVPESEFYHRLKSRRWSEIDFRAYSRYLTGAERYQFEIR